MSDAIPVVSEPLALVLDLARALDASGVAWCHWKSNAKLSRSVSGHGDLDVLVDRAGADALIGRIVALGFKRSTPSADRRFSGIDDYHGLDAASGRLVHLQLHRQLVLGAPLVKNHRLPIERAVLDGAIREGPVRVPDPACELAVFVLRVFLKARTGLLLLPASAERLLAGSRQELAWLRGRAHDEDARRFLAEHLAAVPSELFSDCLRALESGAGTRALLALRWRVSRALAGYRRRGPLRTVSAWLARRIVVAWHARGGRGGPRKRLDAGGAAIALIGGDGAGKSTAADALANWLGRDLAVRRFHLGKPPPRPTSRLVFALTTGLRQRGAALPEIHRAGGAAPLAGRFATRLVALERWCLARDRWRECRRVRRAVAGGAIAICDRFPLAALPDVDGPGIRALASGDPWLRRLADREERLYREMRAPELAIVLRVSPEVGVGRQPGDDPESVIERCRRIARFCDALPDGAVAVDADADAATVLSRLKQTLWAAL